MFLNPRNNLFNFQFTKDFMPPEIHNKYYAYLNKVRGFPVKNPLDFINYTIQGINLPGLNSDMTEQSTMYGRKKTHLNTIHPQEMYSKELTISFRMSDAFLNYFILMDLLNYYYAFDTNKRYIPDQRVYLLDGDGNQVVTIELTRILFTSIGDLSLNFSSNVPEYQSFDCTFIYNQLDMKIDFESNN